MAGGTYRAETARYQSLGVRHSAWPSALSGSDRPLTTSRTASRAALLSRSTRLTAAPAPAPTPSSGIAHYAHYGGNLAEQIGEHSGSLENHADPAAPGRQRSGRQRTGRQRTGGPERDHAAPPRCTPITTRPRTPGSIPSNTAPTGQDLAASRTPDVATIDEKPTN